MRYHRPRGSSNSGPAQGARWGDTRSSSHMLAPYTRASHAYEKHQDCLPWETAAARARALYCPAKLQAQSAEVCTTWLAGLVKPSNFPLAALGYAIMPDERLNGREEVSQQDGCFLFFRTSNHPQSSAKVHRAITSQAVEIVITAEHSSIDSQLSRLSSLVEVLVTRSNLIELGPS